MLKSIMFGFSGIRADQDYLSALFGEKFRKRSSVRALIMNPGLRAAFWMRIASLGGAAGHFARARLINGFSCDVSPGAVISDALYLPHPLGIVIGRGVEICGPVSLYQGVTLGADKRAGYPTLVGGNRIFPNAVIVGSVILGEGVSVGAGLFVDFDVAENITVRTGRR